MAFSRVKTIIIATRLPRSPKIVMLYREKRKPLIKQTVFMIKRFPLGHFPFIYTYIWSRTGEVEAVLVKQIERGTEIVRIKNKNLPKDTCWRILTVDKCCLRTFAFICSRFTTPPVRSLGVVWCVRYGALKFLVIIKRQKTFPRTQIGNGEGHKFFFFTDRYSFAR